MKPACPKAPETTSRSGPENPPSASGVAMGRIRTPSCAPRGSSAGPRPSSRTSAGLLANGWRNLENACRSAAATFSVVRGRSSPAAFPPGARRGAGAAASIISSIGVMPAIGSFGNCPSEYATAPSRRPSMYTGLPLIPAMTPVAASGPPSRRAMTRLRRGAAVFRRTPRTRTVNSSTRSPSKTVRPTPTIPGRTSSTDMYRDAASGQAAMASATATIAAKVDRFMSGLGTALIIARHACAPRWAVRVRPDTIASSR